jgi:molybdopterin biosynthesis enzyme MoaB
MFLYYVVSDRCSAGEAEDKSGDNLAHYINQEWKFGKVVLRGCIADDVSLIEVRGL